MQSFKEILDNIKNNSGIKRVKYNISDPDIAYKCFVDIGNAMLQWKGVDYDTTHLKDVIKIFIDWAYMLPNDKISFTKGILLKGSTGRGKTFLFKIFQEFLKIDNMQYFSNGVKYPLLLKEVNARSLASMYQTEGYNSILEYSKMPVLIINDIGAENSESVSFGNRINIIERLLDLREENNLLTFGTTNLDKLSTNYDSRTISRMNSLFNVVIVNHKTDYRKNG